MGSIFMLRAQVLVADEVGEGDAVDFQAAGDAGFGEAALEQA